MEVNFFGHVRVTKACLPLLKRHARWASGGASRIVNVTSFSGLLPGLPMKSGAFHDMDQIYKPTHPSPKLYPTPKIQ